MVASSKRLEGMPDVPTSAEAGLKGFEVASWQAVFAPAGTPKPVVQRLNSEIARILRSPEVRTRLDAMAMEPDGGSPESLGDYQKAEIVKWAKVVKDANIKID